MNKFIKSIIIPIALIIVQIFVINNLQLRGMLNSFVAPSIYILIILLMPLGSSYIRLLFLAFILGFTVDFLSGTMGENTSACLLIAFLRPWILNKMTNYEERSRQIYPSIKNFGFLRFLIYIFIFSSIFHHSLFFLEVFTFYEFYYTILRAVLSTITATTIMVLIMFFVRKKSKNIIR
ncbi:MAG: rod shape-determining protein MreD [Bacteroidales bacterium]